MNKNIVIAWLGLSLVGLSMEYKNLCKNFYKLLVEHKKVEKALEEVTPILVDIMFRDIVTKINDN